MGLFNWDDPSSFRQILGEDKYERLTTKLEKDDPSWNRGNPEWGTQLTPTQISGESNEKLDEFWEFLRANGVSESGFLDLCRRKSGIWSYKKVKRAMKTGKFVRRWIMHPIAWKDTHQGYDFWGELNNLWVSKCYKRGWK